MVDGVIVVVVIAIAVVEIVPAQVRMDPTRRVMTVVMVIRVRVHQRRAQRADGNSEGKRDREDPAAHCPYSSGIQGFGPGDTEQPESRVPGL